MDVLVSLARFVVGYFAVSVVFTAALLAARRAFQGAGR